MALIICPECEKEFSDRAVACPNCGCPTEEALSILKAEEEKQKAKETCPYCGSDSIGEDGYCNSCGMKISALKKYIEEQKIVSSINVQTGNTEVVNDKAQSFKEANLQYLGSQNKVIADPVVENFTGIYKYSLFGGKIEVYCPRCGSSDCSHYQEQKIIPGKSKTRYSMNLNPLHPFTLVNKKEKIIKKEQSVTEQKIICNSCGHIFY